MKTRLLVAITAATAFGVLGGASASGFAGAQQAAPQAPAAKSAKAAKPQPARSAGAVDAAQVQAYAAHFLPFDPDTKVIAEKAAERLPGMQGWKIHRKGRYEKLNVDRTYYVSDDGKWFFAGDSLVNTLPAPRPVKSAADLGWVEEKFSTVFQRAARVVMVPERDSAPYKGVGIQLETGYGPVRMPGLASADGKAFLQGGFWDFRMDPREERRRRIDLSTARATGRPEAAVNMVEFADMECGYCKMRGLQMDRLLEANTATINVRRHYKFFPLWLGHVWSMKAASAAECIFRASGAPAMFKFKESVYARQESMTSSGIDELAVTFAESAGITSADFLSCYLQEPSFARVRREIEEGYRLGVNSTPTYFIDGTEITWVEDKVMEDFLRTLFPMTKSISYGPAVGK